MVDPQQFRALVEQFTNTLEIITTSRCYTKYQFHEQLPTTNCQYWTYKLDFLRDEPFNISSACGYFSGEGLIRNHELDVNRFFENNDQLFEEFLFLNDGGEFQQLFPLLIEANKVASPANAIINVEAGIIGGDEWLRNLCEEPVFIIHIDDDEPDKIRIDCMQSERYRIKVENDMGHVSYFRVPYDKVGRFQKAERIEGFRDGPYYPYEVALSFAGEDRNYVSRVARLLRKRNVRVFYDEYEKVTLWGKDLYDHFSTVYKNKAKYCVIFVSKYYKDKVWTNLERQNAFARALNEKNEYVLPVRLDETTIPGLRDTICYIDGKTITPSKLADLIYRKVYITV